MPVDGMQMITSLPLQVEAAVSAEPSLTFELVLCLEANECAGLAVIYGCASVAVITSAHVTRTAWCAL